MRKVQMQQDQKGFTLIELMIVVAIIGILAAVALPQYQAYTKKSADSACLAEAKGLMSGIVAAISNEDEDLLPTTTLKRCTGTVPTTLPDAGDTLTFTPVNGSAGKTVDCEAGTGNCALVPW